MSWVTTLLVSFLSIGLGVLGGFGGLYQQFSMECNSLLKSADSKATSLSRTLKRSNDEAKEDLVACLEKESQYQRSCQDAQSETLKAHNNLVVQHQKLWQDHDTSMERVTAAQKDLDHSQQITHFLEEKVSELQTALDQAESCDQKRVDSLQQRLNLAQSMLQQKIQEVEALESQLQTRDADTPFAAMEQLQKIQATIQQQHFAQMRLQYGGGGSGDTSRKTVVEFQVRVGNLENQQAATPHLSFQVELSTAYSMTVGTFLKLVQSDLYVGTTLQIRNGYASPTITGGNPKQSATKRIQANLTRKFAEHGYGMEPFLWNEKQSGGRYDCDENNNFDDDQAVFWFPTLGPQFQISKTISTNTPCHGQVIQGMEDLLEQTTEPMMISSVRILEPRQPDTTNNDEL
mmetsp:Transcript_7638/g.9994  ORF Transcript_7638/g.9994 Transcript_7638/m.9994 type:complete len:403 (+) Transcript_7638:203-1411(+)|eukprot:CAMPEP_0198139458 /NCGR_PEP_ID=MMETSP1443-20131203/2738_1 /TAXON_ID=186043 /ORGANISM="Entomoneis sp., Strain CCMP2396" /LENGTH=402 /DNA_ID=CAMNT_0043801577 /DNA_START=118 /DNA_END=1326 /DNA_ORIENTATION=+